MVRRFAENNSPLNRNPLISRTLYRSGDIEACGTGIKRIKDECDAAGIKVEYVKVPNGTKLVFHRNDPFGQSLVVGDKVTNTVTDGTQNGTVKDTRNPNSNQTNRNEIVLSEIRRKPDITGAELAESLGVSVRTIRRALKDLQDAGLIAREGSDKTGRWMLLK